MKIFVYRGRILWLLLSGVLLVASCQKKDSPRKNAGKGGASMEDSLKFYTWFYTLSDSQNLAQYYWNDQVPAINPFSTQFANADSLLSGQGGIASYPVVNGLKVDRYSFLDRTGAVSDQIEGGQLGNMGMEITWANDQGTTSLWVIYTYGNSPAGDAGVQRGWQIVKVNGSSNVTYDGPGYGDGSSTNLNNVVNAVYNDPSASFTFARPSGADTTISLSSAQYSFNPILLDTILTMNAKPVGYFVFSTFSDVYTYNSTGAVSGGTLTKTMIDNAFQKFKSANIKDLIVDLRYNGGGAVSTAEYLDSLIAPSSASGKEMYEYKFNKEFTSLYASANESLAVIFGNTGGLSLDHVFFIVGPDTYSASELTMNNLKPYMDVKLVGARTGGKPVGFIPQPIYVVNDTTGQDTHVADLYAINFETENSLHQGGYFTGIQPDFTAADYVDLNWGSPADSNLIAIDNFISSGSFSRGQARLSKQQRSNIFRTSPSPILKRGFQGMVDYRLHLQKGLLPKLK